jgi:hypothetical protein
MSATTVLIMETPTGTKRLAIQHSELETAKHVLNTLGVKFQAI